MTIGAGLFYAYDAWRGTPIPPVPILVIDPNQAVTAIPATVRPSPSAVPTSTLIAAVYAPDPDVLGVLMMQAPNVVAPANELYRQMNAFTIAPARPRAGTIQYTIRPGDTVENIAKRFNLSQDSIVWNNDIQYINRLQPGTVLTIPPIDGVLYSPMNDETIQEIADKFKVSPFAIIDSEYNRLSQAVPTTQLPANLLTVMIPGGISKKIAIYWKPAVDMKPAVGRGVGQVNFGGGSSSCGFVSNGGGDGSLGRPLNGYTVIRGFSSYHSGFDLADSTGTPVLAAGSGTVIFAGWSEWGYGNAVVIAHTSTVWTLYAHMSKITVSCGQFISRAGQVGTVGSTGNSTGPHLHFETRVNNEPVNPTSFIGGF